MHRQPVIDLLSSYRQRWPDEAATVQRMVELVTAREDCLLRTCPPGHVTASCWIVSPDHQSFLLTHHRKLDRWLQLGGHVDGESNVARAALREAREESGMERFRFFADGGETVPIDVDVHRIPARGEEPEHEHHDIRFLLIAEPGQALRISDESRDLRWFANERLAEVGGDSSVVRLGRKAVRLLPPPPRRQRWSEFT